MCGTMLSHALHASFADPADQRVSNRRVLRLEARVASPAGAGGVEVHNLSRTGMLLECTAGIAAGSAIEVELPGGSLHCAEVVWTDEGLFGCRFDKPLTRAQLSAALLRSESRSQAAAPSRPLSPNEALARLHDHWGSEMDEALLGGRKLAVGVRLWTIAALGLAGWAVPAAAAWIFF